MTGGFKQLITRAVEFISILAIWRRANIYVNTAVEKYRGIGPRCWSVSVIVLFCQSSENIPVLRVLVYPAH